MWPQEVKENSLRKEKRIYLHKPQEVRVVRKQVIGAEGSIRSALAFWGVSIGKARQGRVDSLEMASLSNIVGLGAVCGSWLPGPRSSDY